MAPEPNRICSICHWQLQLTDTRLHVCLPNKLAISQISSAQYHIRARVAVVYFTAQSRLHIVINYLQPPETDQNGPYLLPYHRPVPNSTKTEISRIWATSVARLKILCAVEKS